MTVCRTPHRFVRSSPPGSRLASPAALRPISPARALLSLAPSSVLQLAGGGGERLGALRSLCQQVPAYELILGGDVKTAAALVPRPARGSGVAVISVVIAVWNNAQHLADAIESVRAQDRGDVELIVVDHGSTEESAAVGERSGADQVLRLPTNAGLSMAATSASPGAHGELITFLDADDRMLPGRLSDQERFLVEHPEMSGVSQSGATRSNRAQRCRAPTRWPSGCEPTGAGHVHLGHGSCLASWWPSVALTPTCGSGEDVDLLIRCERAGVRRLAALPDVLNVKVSTGRDPTFQVGDVSSGVLAHCWGAVRLAPLVSVIIPVYNGGQATLTDAAQTVSSPREYSTISRSSSSTTGPTDDSLAARHPAGRETLPTLRVFSEPGGGAGAAHGTSVFWSPGAVLWPCSMPTMCGCLTKLARPSWRSSKRSRRLRHRVRTGRGFVSPELPPTRWRLASHPPVAPRSVTNSSMLARRDTMARVGFYRPGRGRGRIPRVVFESGPGQAS